MSNWLKNSKLIALTKQFALQQGEFTLSSGRKSNYFVDMGQVTNRPESLDIIVDSIFHYMTQELKFPIDAVGGPALGAAPLIGGLLIAYQRNLFGQGHLSGFLVRKELKNGSMIEGVLKTGDNVVIIEDVVTTGTQVKRACNIVEEAGGNVCGIIGILDRGLGAKKLLGDRYQYMMTLEDLGVKSGL